MTRGPRALLRLGAASLLVAIAACGGHKHESPCSGAIVIDTYVGGAGDPYFYGYAGDPTFGGSVGWFTPTYYDPSYDPSSEGDGIEDQGPSGVEDSSSSDTSGDDSSGSTNSQAYRLHPTSGPLSVGGVGGACTSCTLACTFAAPGGNTPVGNVAVGEDGESVDAACVAAMIAIEHDANGAPISRCHQVDPAGYVPASPTVGSTATDGGLADAEPTSADSSAEAGPIATDAAADGE